MTEALPPGSVELYAPVAVETALRRQALRLAPGLHALNPLVLVVMTGGLYAAAALTRHFGFPLTVDYVHATRYRGGTAGGDIHWERPVGNATVQARHVLLIDDIFDEGHTLAAIAGHCRDAGAASVRTAVLAVKQHDRGLAREWVDDAALAVPDRYVFGCGMDYHEHWRQLPGIWALPAPD